MACRRRVFTVEFSTIFFFKSIVTNDDYLSTGNLSTDVRAEEN